MLISCLYIFLYVISKYLRLHISTLYSLIFNTTLNTNHSNIYVNTNLLLYLISSSITIIDSIPSRYSQYRLTRRLEREFRVQFGNTIKNTLYKTNPHSRPYRWRHTSSDHLTLLNHI